VGVLFLGFSVNIDKAYDIMSRKKLDRINVAFRHIA